MRYKLFFILENENLPTDYHRNIISYIKKSLIENDEKNFEKFYKNKDNIIKQYTFSLFLNNAKFKNDEIYIKDKKFELNISVEDYETAIILYNSFNHQKWKKFSINKNSMTLQNIILLPEKQVNSENVHIKFLSPLVVRDRNRQTRKDYYYSYSNDKFLETLKINVKQQLKTSKLPNEQLEKFNIVPIKPKKTVVKFYEKQIECSLGEYELIGSKELIKYLYKAGVGSKRSAGFGMFQIL